MGWDSRGRYYRNVRVGKVVVREYYGKGEPALMAERAALLRRQEREALRRERAEALQAERDAVAPLDAAADGLGEAAELAAHAALAAAGYHQHARGAWRRRKDAGDD